MVLFSQNKSKLHFVFACFLSLLLMSAIVFAEENIALLKQGQWRDPATGLIWSRCSLGQEWTGFYCKGYATRYMRDSAQEDIDKGWRLPTVNELETLRVKNKMGYNAPINTLFEPRPHEVGRFWSSSLIEKSAGFVWAVDFRIGKATPSYRFDRYYVRLVRSDQ